MKYHSMFHCTAKLIFTSELNSTINYFSSLEAPTKFWLNIIVWNFLFCRQIFWAHWEIPPLRYLKLVLCGRPLLLCIRRWHRTVLRLMNYDRFFIRQVCSNLRHFLQKCVSVLCNMLVVPHNIGVVDWGFPL